MDGSHRYRGCTILAILIVSFSLQTALVISQGCTYEYIEQPPMDIDCNPYLEFFTGEMLGFRCALRAPMNSQLMINWYLNGSVQQGANLTVTDEREGTEIYRSVFFIAGEPRPGRDSGDYYCQAQVDGVDLLPSETFTLSGDEFAYDVFGECTKALSSDATKCADLPPTTEPVTSPTTPPPQPTPSQTILPTTSTPSHSTVGEIPDTSTDFGTTMISETTVSDGNPDAVPQTLQVWIYVLVGVAAVFFMIIVILTIMCVGLCVRRNKTQDSHTLKRPGHGGTVLSSNSMVSNVMYNSTENNIAAPPQYEDIQSLGLHSGYAHLHCPVPPPLPNGRTTMNSRFQSSNTLVSESVPEPDFVPPTLPPKGAVPEHHVYRELENPLSCSPISPPLSAFERGDSSAQLLPGGGPFSKANGGPYRKFSSDSATLSANESLYSPTTPIGTFQASNGLEDIPETGMSFVEPDDPTAFPVHEYESIPGDKRKTKKYESPVPDVPPSIGRQSQTRVSVKSANYETDPQLEIRSPESSSRGVNPYDSTCHFSTSAEHSASRKFSEPVTTGGLTSGYSQLNFKDGNYSRLGSRNGEGFDPEFFKNASEIHLASRNGINNSHRHHFSNASGGSTLYDSDHSSRETSPLSSANRGHSLPLAPPKVYPAESMYNQLTMPGFQAPVGVASKTTV